MCRVEFLCLFCHTLFISYFNISFLGVQNIIAIVVSEITKKIVYVSLVFVNNITMV